jgi:helicase
MTTVADFFKKSPAKAVLCILDCCFSGRAPARVLEDGPELRDVSDPLDGLVGAGRLLLAASAHNEPALELDGHGLLTQAVLEVLQEGETDIDLVGASAEILRRVRTKAARLGYAQTPTLYGHVAGGLFLPRLVPGPKYRTAFPETAGITVRGPVADLSVFGIPSPVLKEWSDRFHGGLNSLQLAAVNTQRVLDGESVVVVAPTSSGKTFIGEMATIRAHMQARKAVFLLPYRALVNEKYDQFAALYGSALGLRVIRSTGDYLDDNGRFLSGQYDLAVLTYEMFLGLAVANPHVLTQLGLVVLDEAQFITDPKRGIIVELLLTLLLTARDRGIKPQLASKRQNRRRRIDRDRAR